MSDNLNVDMKRYNAGVHQTLNISTNASVVYLTSGTDVETELQNYLPKTQESDLPINDIHYGKVVTQSQRVYVGDITEQPIEILTEKHLVSISSTETLPSSTTTPSVPTTSTLKTMLNRDTPVSSSTTDYTSFMARGIAIYPGTPPNTFPNGCIVGVYETE